MNENIDDLREKYDVDKYEVIQSIGLVALLCNHFCYPVALEKSKTSNYTSCIYKSDDSLFREICNEWDNTNKYSDIKLFNKQFGKIKKAFKTLNLNDFKAYR